MKIGRYEIIGEIGQGAMGTVYRARDPLIEREVAIKTVSIHQLHEEGTDAEARFLREARSAGRLSHPSIVTIYDIGETESLAYIAMEFLPGRTLRDLMDRHPLPLELALDTAHQMAEALAFAHEHGVVHRDIKPANVVVTGRRGRVKLTDFGIAHLLNSNQTQAGQMLGSPRYMSPEQAMGREVDGRSDIFSLGAVLYEMLTGEYAFDGDSLPTIVYRVINETPAHLAGANTLPAALSDLLTRMLQKHPMHRPDAREVAQALSTMHDTGTQSVAVTRPGHDEVSGRRRARVLAVGGLLLAGISVVAINHFQPVQEAAPLSSTSAPLPSAPLAAPIPQNMKLPADLPPARRPVAQQESPRPPAARATQKPAIVADAYLLKLDSAGTELRIKRTELLLRYTEQHPDILQIDRQIEQLAEERRRHVRLLQNQQNQ